jgi:hypothetical protein
MTPEAISNIPNIITHHTIAGRHAHEYSLVAAGVGSGLNGGLRGSVLAPAACEK